MGWARRGGAVSGALALALSLGVSAARAESIGPNEAPGVDVRSGRLSLERDRLTLEGDAVVRVGPARLSGSRITFRRTEGGGLNIGGPFVIGPCPCPGPPLSLRVSEAELGPGLRAKLYGSTVLVFGVPVLPVPWVSLRGPDTVGLLPPRVNYRGEDGWLLGGGVFVPFARGAWARAQPAAYLEGGSDLRLHVQTPRSTMRLRRDQLRSSSFYAVDGRGYAPLAEGTLAWDADLDRGARARRALSDLDEASRIYDRVAVATVWAGRSLSAGAGLRGTLARGLGPWFVGPRLGATLREGGGPWVAALTADASTLGRGGEVAHVGRLDADLGAYGWAGPLRLSVEGRSGVNGRLLPGGEAFEAFSGVEAAASAPFARGYGEGRVHVVEPGLGVLGLGALERGRVDDAFGRPLLPSGGLAALPSAFVEQRFGGERWALGSRLGAGLVASTVGGPAWALRAGTSLGLSWLQGRWEGALGLGGERLAGVSVGRVDVGDVRGGGVGARWAMRRELEPVVARALVPWRSALASGGWLAAAGASVGAEARVPLPGAVLLTLGADVDASEPRPKRLAERAALTYRHRCGCAVFGASAGRRLGRGGVDALISLDIVTPYDAPL
ncbi:MAG TPA: hypothetical protein VFS43_14540 [Polyangiaceae bacterium]|nr:hypothetical protein [Polyangiaceae bacterium]